MKEDGSYKVLAVTPALAPIGDEVLARVERGDLAGARKLLDWAREETPAAGSDDPIAGSPFARLWAKGQAGDETEIRVAAAALVGGETADPKRTGKILEDCRAKDDVRAPACEVALVGVYTSSKQLDKARAVADRLAERAPRSTAAFLLRSAVATLRRKPDEMRRVAEDWLAHHPDDSRGLFLRAQSETAAGDLAAARGTYEQILRTTVDGASLNTIAWMSLVEDRVDDEAVERARKSNVVLGGKCGPCLNTLAALQAERGELAEAYRNLLATLETEGREHLNPADWLVYGRIAEGYGFLDVARAAYARGAVGETAAPDAVSELRLARKRLEALKKKRK